MWQLIPLNNEIYTQMNTWSKKKLNEGDVYNDLHSNATSKAHLVNYTWHDSKKFSFFLLKLDKWWKIFIYYLIAYNEINATPFTFSSNKKIQFTELKNNHERDLYKVINQKRNLEYLEKSNLAYIF